VNSWDGNVACLKTSTELSPSMCRFVGSIDDDGFDVGERSV
jgi:hypothetical protein